MAKPPMGLTAVWAVVLLTAAAAFGRTGLGAALVLPVFRHERAGVIGGERRLG